MEQVLQQEKQRQRPDVDPHQVVQQLREGRVVMVQELVSWYMYMYIKTCSFFVPVKADYY